MWPLSSFHKIQEHKAKGLTFDLIYVGKNTCPKKSIIMNTFNKFHYDK